MEKRKVILYISMSIDGFIATKEDDLSWLSIVQNGSEDYGYSAFNETVDTYIVGRKTYEVVKKLTGGNLPQADKFDCYVLTRQTFEKEKGIQFYNGDVVELIQKLKEKKGKHIYCDGGGQVVKLLMDHDLIDEYVISIIPIVLGDGKRLFHGETPMIKFKQISSKSYESGLVQIKYSK